MRQASWIAFLLFTVGLVTYEAAIDTSSDGTESISISSDAPAEGGGEFPPPRP
jgi:hypothetical protein